MYCVCDTKWNASAESGIIAIFLGFFLLCLFWSKILRCDQILWKWLTIGHIFFFFKKKNSLRYRPCQLPIALSRWIKEKYSYAIWWLQEVCPYRKKAAFQKRVFWCPHRAHIWCAIYTELIAFLLLFVRSPVYLHTQNFMFSNLTDSQFHKYFVLTLRTEHIIYVGNVLVLIALLSIPRILCECGEQKRQRTYPLNALCIHLNVYEIKAAISIRRFVCL